MHDGRSLSFTRDSQPAQGLYYRHPRPFVPGRNCAGLYLGSGHVLYKAGQRYEPAVGLACSGYWGAPVGPVLPNLRDHRLSKLPDHTALPGTETVLVHVLPLHPRGYKHLRPQVWCLATVELLLNDLERLSRASWKGEGLTCSDDGGNATLHKVRASARHIPIIPLFPPV